MSAADAEIQSRVKKPSIAIMPGASTSEDICPWEAPAPEPDKTEKNLEVRSRKNSGQLDSGSSSSDISLAIAEVSDRLRRSCGLAQQQTLDGDKRGQTRKLSTASCVEVRRASVSLPTKFFSESNRPSVSSFEEITASGAQSQSQSQSLCDSSSIAPSASITVTIPSDTDNNEESFAAPAPAKPLKKAHSLKKTSSITGANAPTINVSSVIDDVIVDADEPQDHELHEGAPLPLQLPLAPLAVPDSESPGSELAPSDIVPLPGTAQPAAEAAVDPLAPTPVAYDDKDKDKDPSGTLEGKQTDICPWEDE